MDSILATKIIFYFITLSQVVNAGFLQAPFPYFVNPGDPITSAASPFIHGFGSPLVSPLVNFYHPPLLKTFFSPVFYHQPPQFFNLPAPQFYTLPQTTAASAPATGYGGPNNQEEQKAAEQPTGYGPPPPSGPNNQFQSSPSGFNNPGKGDRFSSPSGSGPSSYPKLEVFQDDFRGDRESVVVDADRARGPEFQPSNDNFQSFVVNSRDNSIKDDQQRPFRSRPGSTTGGSGY